MTTCNSRKTKIKVWKMNSVSYRLLTMYEYNSDYKYTDLSCKSKHWQLFMRFLKTLLKVRSNNFFFFP